MKNLEGLFITNTAKTLFHTKFMYSSMYLLYLCDYIYMCDKSNELFILCLKYYKKYIHSIVFCYFKYEYVGMCQRGEIPLNFSHEDIGKIFMIFPISRLQLPILTLTNIGLSKLSVISIIVCQPLVFCLSNKVWVPILNEKLHNYTKISANLV